MKHLYILILFFSLLVSPQLCRAQVSNPAADTVTLTVAADTTQHGSSSPGDDYSRYARKGPKDNLWKYSAAFSLLLMMIVLLLIMRRRKK